MLSPAILPMLLMVQNPAPDPPVADADTPIIVTALPPRAGDPVYGGERVDAARLRGTASGRIETALVSITGLQQFRRSDGRSANASAQGLTLRSLGGNAASRTLLLLDGVPQGDAFFGSIAFATIAPETLSGASVVRGSGAGPFGSGALAGVISLESRALEQRPAVDLAVAGGSDAAHQASIGIVLPLGAGHVALDLGSEGGDGFFTTPVEQRNAGTVRARYAAQRAALSVTVPLSDQASLSARIAGFSDRRTLRLAGADSRSDGVDASVRLIAQGRWGVEALGWVQLRDFANVVVSTATLRPTLDQRATPATGWGAKFELRAPSATPGTGLRFGIDARGAAGRVVEDVLASSGARTLNRTTGGRTSQVGLFAEWDAAFGPLLLTIGARGDRVEQSGGFLTEVRGDGSVAADRRFAARTDWLGSVRGGVAWDATPTLRLRIAGYGGHRVPTLNELYRPFVLFPVTTRANPALTPERLWGAEVGARFVPRAGVSFDLTLFDNRLSDAIGNVTLTPTLRERRNFGTIVARGVELRGDAALGAGWHVGGGLAATRARVQTGVRAGDAAGALDGRRPAQAPGFTASAELARDWRGGARTTLLLRHIGAAYEDDLNRDRLPAVQTVDAVVDVPLGHGWRAVARAENLFDARIVTRNAGGTVDLGTPRLLWLGLRWTR
jgi:outer membrane receptor protein involved in Fe transport